MALLFHVISIKFPEWGMFGSSFRKENPRVKELFDNIEKLREEFEAIERPILELETPPNRSTESETPSSAKPEDSPSNSALQVAEIPEANKSKRPESPSVKPEQVLDPEAELAKLESEFGKVNPDYSAEEIGGWEFDELERELISSDSTTSK